MNRPRFSDRQGGWHGPTPGVQIYVFADGSILGCVHGCPKCRTWTRCVKVEPRRYPYHGSCSWSWENLPVRLAHLGPDGADAIAAGGANRILAILDDTDEDAAIARIAAQVGA